PALPTATMPPLPARNSPTRARAAIARATTISSRVKPRTPQRRPLASAGGIGNTDAPGQPIDPDHDLAAAVSERDAAAGRAAVGIESDIAGIALAPFAGNRQQLDRHGRREKLRLAAAGAKAMGG